MKYTKLGNSDLTVSRICMGCMGFGEQFVSLAEHYLSLRALHEPLVVLWFDAWRTSHHDLVIFFISTDSLKHRRQVVFYLLFARSCQKGDKLIVLRPSTPISWVRYNNRQVNLYGILQTLQS